MILVPAFDYTLSFENLSVTNGNGTHDLFTLDVPSDRIAVVTAVELVAVSETGDANEAYLRLAVILGNTVAASGGASATARKPNEAAPVAATTCRTGDTTIASGGTELQKWAGGLNVRLPAIHEFYKPFVVKQTDNIFALRLMAAVTNDLILNGTLYFSEI
jgi:hypothetical protein